MTIEAMGRNIKLALEVCCINPVSQLRIKINYARQVKTEEFCLISIQNVVENNLGVKWEDVLCGHYWNRKLLRKEP